MLECVSVHPLTLICYQNSCCRYIDRVEVTETVENQSWQSAWCPTSSPSGSDSLISDSRIFPIHRWIKSGTRLMVSRYDSSLPQDDMNIEQREKELKEKREDYRLAEKILGAPLQVSVFSIKL